MGKRDETSKKLLDTLRTKPTATNEILALDISMSKRTVVDHLRLLKDAGLIRTTLKKQRIYGDSWHNARYIEILEHD